MHYAQIGVFLIETDNVLAHQMFQKNDLVLLVICKVAVLEQAGFKIYSLSLLLHG